MDCLGRAFIHTGFTIYTRVSVNDGNAILHMNCFGRTDIYAGFTACAFISVYNCYHFKKTSKKVCVLKKNKVSIVITEKKV